MISNAGNQSTSWASEVARHADCAGKRGIQSEWSGCAIDLGGNANDFTVSDRFRSTERGIAGEDQCASRVNQAMQDQPVVIFVQQNSSATQVGGAQRADTDLFAVEDGGGHADSTCTEPNGSILSQ